LRQRNFSPRLRWKAFDSGGGRVLTEGTGLPPRFNSIRRMTHFSGDPSNMNKQELIAQVADISGLGKGEANKAVEAVFESISAALKKGDEVRLVGFGTFSVSKRKASTGRNPRTGEEMTIKASNQPKFKAGKGLKDSVNI
jgi:DNA-binding protein HU-beta